MTRTIALLAGLATLALALGCGLAHFAQPPGIDGEAAPSAMRHVSMFGRTLLK